MRPTTPDPRPDPFAPMEGQGFVSTFEHLLKKPGSVVHRLSQPGAGRILVHLATATAICFIVFGLLLGTFRLGDQLWASPVKIMAGIFFSGLLCLPSLYIFSCLNGLTARFETVAGTLLGIMSLIGLLLLGFSPVVWIFAQSTDSAIFMGGIVLVFWVVSFAVGITLLSKLAAFLGTRRIGYLRVWMCIFLVVTIQVSTSLRPIFAPQEGDFILPAEKKFFLSHWADEIKRELDGNTQSDGWQPEQQERGR